MTGLWREGVAAPLVLTAELPAEVMRPLDAIRRASYPEGAARVPAHLTLFRHLPGPQLASLSSDLKRLVAEMPMPVLRVDGLARPDSSVAVTISSPGLAALRDRLADWWGPLLVPGDRAPLRLHITLAAKMAPPVARALAARLQPDIRPQTAQARALLLWQHGEPHWTPLVRLAFRR